MSSIAAPHVTFPSRKPDSSVCARLFDSSVQWREHTGSWPAVFVIDVGATSKDVRTSRVIDFLLDCGFAIHRSHEIDSVESARAGVDASHAQLVLICRRGFVDQLPLRQLVLAMPDVDYILVAGELPPETDREGDPGSRFDYVDAVDREPELIFTIQFIMRGLKILQS